MATAPGDVRLAYHVADIDDSGHHTGAAVPFASGEILISDTPSTPLIFADLLQNDDQTDLLYEDT